MMEMFLDGYQNEVVIVWAFFMGFWIGRTYMYYKVDRILDRYSQTIGVDNAVFIQKQL